MNRLVSFAAAVSMVLAGAAGRAEATEYIYTLIDYPGAIETRPEGITDSGQIVGWFRGNDGAHGFNLSGGVYTPIDHPDAVTTPPYGGTGMYGVNVLGQIVGAYDASDGTVRGYLRDGDSYVDLTPSGSSYTWATGISDTGTATGYYEYAGGAYRGFLFDGTNYSPIDDPGAVTTYALGINNAGVIAGAGVESAGYPHAFIRKTDGTFSTYFVFGYPADAQGINDLDQIVGAYGPSPDELYGYVLSGVVATPEMLVVPGSTDTVPNDINNLGQVVGLYSNANGNWRGFLATPIPEIPGDYNRNGVVDAADYTVWRDTLGSTFDMRANGDNSGASAHVIDAADYDMWRAHFGETASVPGATGSAGADATIPEPASLVLLVVAATWLLAGVRPRH